MNPAQALYTGAAENLPASDVAALCNVFRITIGQARFEYGDVADQLNVCRCGVIVVAPLRMCDDCLEVKVMRDRQRALEYAKRHYGRHKGAKAMKKTRAENQQEKAAARREAQLPPSIEQLRRSVNYTPEKEREMKEQAAALHQWSKSGVRSVKRLREMQI